MTANSDLTAPPPPGATCDQCGRPLGALPPTAPHKRFCSEVCRRGWHNDWRKRARQLLEQQGKTMEHND